MEKNKELNIIDFNKIRVKEAEKEYYKKMNSENAAINFVQENNERINARKEIQKKQQKKKQMRKKKILKRKLIKISITGVAAIFLYSGVKSHLAYKEQLAQGTEYIEESVNDAILEYNWLRYIDDNEETKVISGNKIVDGLNSPVPYIVEENYNQLCEIMLEKGMPMDWAAIYCSDILDLDIFDDYFSKEEDISAESIKFDAYKQSLDKNKIYREDMEGKLK